MNKTGREIENLISGTSKALVSKRMAFHTIKSVLKITHSPKRILLCQNRANNNLQITLLKDHAKNVPKLARKGKHRK